MATPPGNSTVNQATSGGVAQRSIPTPFLTKTYQIVDDPSIDDVISWNEDGSAFIVWNPTIFARDLLPKYFKHNNLSSFVRQLNTYGFRKVAPDRWEFANDCFRRGEKRLLRDIQRRKTPTAQSPPSQPSTVVTVAEIPMTPPQSVSPTVSNDDQAISNSPPPLAIPTASVGNNNGAGWSSSSSINNNSNSNNGGVDLIDENERLRGENLQLSRKLMNMKSLCSNIFALMSNYSNLPTTISAVGAGYTEIDMLRPMDLLQRDGEDGGGENAAETAVGSPTRLFGFEIGSKRTRDEGSGGGGGSVNLMVDVEVKSEPFDGGSGDLDGDDDDHCHQQAPWMRLFHRQREKMSNL